MPRRIDRGSPHFLAVAPRRAEYRFKSIESARQEDGHESTTSAGLAPDLQATESRDRLEGKTNLPIDVGDAPCPTLRSSTPTAPIRAAGRSPSAIRRSTCLFPQRSSNWER